jgi:hypothetical protein
MKKYLFLICLILIPGCFVLCGCNNKMVSCEIPEVRDPNGVVLIPRQLVTYKETNFLSEDIAEGLWFQFDRDGILAELNRSETSTDSVIKLARFLVPLLRQGTYTGIGGDSD